MALRVGGLVLAGGRSRRFGSEKAVAVVRGAPMLVHVARALAQGCVEVAVNAPAGSGAAALAASRGWALLADAPGDPDGPLAGVRAGLVWARAQAFGGLVTCPCDTPGLPPDAAGRLAAALADAPCAYAVSPDGPHPLCAAWRIDRLAELEVVLAGGHPSVWRLLDSWGASRVPFPEAAPFANVNTPADRADNAPRVAP